MQDTPCNYVLSDPIGRKDSGITTYVRNAASLLKKSGFAVHVVSKLADESIEQYRTRLAEAVTAIRESGRRTVVEAPETDAATAAIPTGLAEIHIRLHCSRNLGSFIQGQPVNVASQAAEQAELDRAAWISSPSKSAVVASRTLFTFPDDSVCCYPNPGPSAPSHERVVSSLRDSVLFIGRLQPLKGIAWIPRIAQRLPEIPFIVAGPTGADARRIAEMPNVRIVDGISGSKAELFSFARVTIIPSLYETASMVGIESLMAGVPVVAWGHLGIAEYADSPMVTSIRPWCLPDFVDAIRKNFDVENRPDCKNIPDISHLYLEGVKSTIAGVGGNFMPIVLGKNNRDLVKNSIYMLRENPMLQLQSEPRWRRKLRKLRRDPARFFRDSWIGRAVTPSVANANVAKSVPVLSGRDHPEPAAYKDDREATTSKEKRNHAEASSAVIEMPPVVTQAPSKLFCHIRRAGRIEFGAPPEKPQGLIVAFLSNPQDAHNASDILQALAQYEDFRYVQPPQLQIGTFEELVEANSLDLLDRIDLQNKKKISGIDHIVMLNPQPVLVEALRSCGTRQRTIVVIDKAETDPPSPWHTDVLIVVGENLPLAGSDEWRRKIVVQNVAQLPLGIRRAIQEGAPKSPDVLLPIFGFQGDYRHDFTSLDIRYHQGIINIPKDCRIADGIAANVCEQLSVQMQGMAVTESVYLRYRSLCDRASDHAIRARLLSYCLFDGVMFDVRT